MGRFRYFYGSSPLHLLAMTASFALTGFAVAGWFQRSLDVAAVLVWFAAAIIAHDLVLVPFYSLLDVIAFGRGGGRRHARAAKRTANRVSAVAYVRVPALLSALLLIVFLPLVLGLGGSTFHAASGRGQSGYAARWLAATGVLFAGSALAYALVLRRVRAARGERRAERP